MAQTNRRFNGPRTGTARASTAARSGAPRGMGGGAAPGAPVAPHRRWEPSSEELFGRKPFTSGPEPRYFGTGVPGYESGPGFTGGYYGYGDESPGMATELEREYAYEVYGEEPGPGWQPTSSAHPTRPAAPVAPHETLRRPRPARRYPPGPKGYRRSDQRMLEDICDRLFVADHIDSSEVTIEVSAAKAVLDGAVPQRWMKHAIEDLADACPGIEDVENRIRVVKPAPITRSADGA